MYIALDIGGTNIRIAASERLDNPSVDTLKKIAATDNYTVDFSNIVAAIGELTANKKIDAIGCGFPGPLSEDRTIMQAANLPNWIGKNLAVDLEEKFECKIYIDNDDTISALGEATYGQGKESSFVYITWGTGFGGAKVEKKNEELLVKQFEAGHQIIAWGNGRLCGCGQTGCAEAYIGGGNIEKYYGKNASLLTNEEWDEVCTYFAQALINVIAFNPTPLIIIGGGIAINNSQIVEIIKNKVAERLKIYPTPEIVVTKLGDNLGLSGAFALIK